MSETNIPPKADTDTLYKAAVLDYSAGTLPAGAAFVVAAHLALKPQAREAVRVLEATGGALLDEIEPVALAKPAWLDDLASEPSAVSDKDDARDVAHMLATLDQGKWKRNLAGMLVKPVPGVKAELLKLEAGRSVPHHGHHGLELTLVLSGEFSDGHGVYKRGDLVIHDEESEHQPAAVAGGDCICLISQTAPIRLNGPLGWLINRFAV
jgi:putative transcriptional regulator